MVEVNGALFYVIIGCFLQTFDLSSRLAISLVLNLHPKFILITLITAEVKQ